MLQVIVWGSRGSIPVSGSSFHRHGGATTCIEIIPQNPSEETPSRIIIDCGTGLTELGKNWEDRTAEALILQTHMHWDHIQGFPFFAPLFNPAGEFQLWAVPRDELSFHEVLSQQMKRPTFPIGLDILPANLTFKDLPQKGDIQLGDLEIKWTEVSHPSGTTAYRINYKGTSVVFSGDLEIQQGSRETFTHFANKTDLLIMDAQYFPEEYQSKKGFGHSTLEDAVEVAKNASVKHLLMTHHDPTDDDKKLDKKRAFAKKIAPENMHINNAYDGLQVDVRASKHISSSQEKLLSIAI